MGPTWAGVTVQCILGMGVLSLQLTWMEAAEVHPVCSRDRCGPHADKNLNSGWEVVELFLAALEVVLGLEPSLAVLSNVSPCAGPWLRH